MVPIGSTMLEKEDRSSLIDKRLGIMADLAEKRRRVLRELNKHNRDWYIRIRAEDYRAVSLNGKTPLCHFAQGGAKNIDTVKKHFMKDPSERFDKEVSRIKKPERSIQCWIIKQALAHQLDLKRVLCLDNIIYEELLFALDEVSLGDKDHKPIKRCDILAVGVRKAQAFPVLIELKWDHQLTTLVRQLNQFCEEIMEHKGAFAELLKNCSGRKVDASRTEKMIIWNYKGNLKRGTKQKLREGNIKLVEYKGDPNTDITGVTFHPFSVTKA